jgi:acyl carrier protein
MASTGSTREQLKRLIIEHLNLEGMTPEMIGDEEPLFGDGLGLDSVDALELVVALEKEHSIRIDNPESTPEAFSSVASLAAFVEAQKAAAGGSDPEDRRPE